MYALSCDIAVTKRSWRVVALRLLRKACSELFGNLTGCLESHMTGHNPRMTLVSHLVPDPSVPSEFTLA
jgi:hypothetical protein